MTPVLIVTGDFVTTGGMDRANHALASYLARQGREVHLVAYRAADDLLAHPNVHFHRVAKPLNAYLLGEPLLNRAGRCWAKRISARGGRVIVNGGNCRYGDLNWVHYVHAAYRAESTATGLRRLKHRYAAGHNQRTERSALAIARVILANSERTRRDLTGRLGLPAERIRVVYYGSDTAQFQPATDADRAALRRRLELPADRPLAVFIGALGDRRKGFDTLLTAWTSFAPGTTDRPLLLVVGHGAELPLWQQRVAAAGLADHIRFFGFRSDVPDILRAADLLVAPTRYEAYGLGVHEALCCGLPAIVSASAGVAEQLPRDLDALRLQNPDDPAELLARLRHWQCERPALRTRVLALAATLRQRTWDAMSADIAGLLDAPATTPAPVGQVCHA